MSGERRVGKRAEQKRRWDRENLERPCSVCGRVRRSKRTGPCQRCLSERAQLRADRIVLLWNQGALIREIAEDLGTTFNSLQVDLDRLRKNGRLSYRYNVTNGKRRAA